jgi:acetolactate synthase-1/2/3 large subunit
MNVAKIIYNKLLQHNVKDAFIYTGGAIMPLIDCFHKQNEANKINYFINTHEQNAGHAATAYARVTGRTGISIMTSGPGLTNSITALTDATNDSTPLILFTGNVPLSAIGTNAFQECPATEISKPVTKWSYLIKDVKEVSIIIDEAFRIAQSGKPGSVHIDIPKCILTSIYRDSNNSNNLNNLNNLINIDMMYNSTNKKHNYFNINNIRTVEKKIHKSERPVILVGQGCNNYSKELREFAIKSNIPVTTTIHAMGIFDETHKLSLDFLGMHGSVAANYSIQNADLIIALGTRFDDRITGKIEEYAPEAFKAYKEDRGGIIHVNINQNEIGKIIDTHYNFNMDCGQFLNKINMEFKERKDWFNRINNWKQKYNFTYKKVKRLKTQEVISAINKKLLTKSDYIITSGVGNHQMMAAQFIKWRYPKSFITSGSLGVMGVGLPFAIGSQIAHPDKLVLDIDGDGSFNHTLSELKTVENYKLPIKIAIMNDGHLSMVKTWEELFFNNRYTATNLNKNPDYIKLAEAYGIKAISCNKREDLENKVEELLEYKGAILCDFRVETDKCYPLVAPGSALDNIWLNDNDIKLGNKLENQHVPN